MIPQEHLIQCSTCNQYFDARDIGQVFAHGQLNETTGKYECHEAQDIPYSTSKKVGEPVEYTKDKTRIDLN